MAAISQENPMLHQVDGPPPADAVRVFGWRQFASSQKPATFIIQDPSGETRKLTVRGRRRQVLEHMMAHPLYAASFARVSDIVLALRERGLSIRTDMHVGDPQVGTETFGVYHSESRVTLEPSGAAE